MEPIYQHILLLLSRVLMTKLLCRYEQTDEHFTSFAFRQPTCRVIIIKKPPDEIIYCRFEPA